VSRKSYVTITGKVGAQNHGEERGPLGPLSIARRLPGDRHRDFILFTCCFFTASLVVALGANHAWTPAALPRDLHEGLKAIRDTLIIAGAGMPLGGLFGILVGYLVVKKQFPGRHAMEVVLHDQLLPAGTIVGIAYLMAFNDRPSSSPGTP